MIVICSRILGTTEPTAPATASMIHAQHLTKTYEDLQRGSFVAVDAISFAVNRGEIFGLLGPNGAGKTTVLRILSTVLGPTSGIAKVNGYDVVREPAKVRRSIGFVSNNTAIYDRMTAWELVEYFGRLHGMPADELRPRLETLFAQLRMNDFRDIPGGKMSTGMRQKVSIARAMVHDPPVLVFDEATLGLDGVGHSIGHRPVSRRMRRVRNRVFETSTWC